MTINYEESSFMGEPLKYGFREYVMMARWLKLSILIFCSLRQGKAFFYYIRLIP